MMRGGSKDQNDEPGERETFAAMLEGVPVFGKVLKAFVMAPDSVKFRYAFVIALCVLYPIWCVFATLAIVRNLPQAIREPVQGFVLASVGYDRERRNLRVAGIRSVNESNRSIDGSLPMTFLLDQGAASQEYYFDVERNQPIAFASFQKSESRLLKDPKCISAEVPRQGEVIGYLSLLTPGERYSESFPVGFSPSGLRVVQEVDSAKWASIPGKSERVQFQFYLTPEKSFESSAYFACQRLSVHVNMTFKKLAQREDTK